jgi:hypothetical protein
MVPGEADTQVEGPPQGWASQPGPPLMISPRRQVLPPVPPPPNRYVRVPSFGDFPE